MHSHSAQSEYFQALLHPSPAQRLKLDELLAGPIFLQRLFALSTAPIETLRDASKFLDDNWRRLSPYMFEGSARRSPKQLENLILDISRSKTSSFALDFASQCMLTSRDEVILPIPGLAEINLVYPAELRLARTNMRHEGGFTLITTAVNYEVGITFFPITAVSINTSSAVRPRSACPTRNCAPAVKYEKPDRHKKIIARPGKQRAVVKPQVTARMSVTDFLAAFNNRITAILNAQLKVSQSYTTTRFGDLEGRAVSGGLPSLPRRR